MTTETFPAFFVSHGGGPWPWISDMKAMFARSVREFARLPGLLPDRPKAILVITGHWEADDFTVSMADHPPMEYDYYGFPDYTYHIQYKAPGSTALAARIGDLLAGAGIEWKEDAERGFDHGTFVPLSLMYPAADIPVVMLSMKSSYDPAEHIRVGRALAPLRAEGVLILGSGSTYHDLRGFRQIESVTIADAFEAYLHEAITAPDTATRDAMLARWLDAPGARLAHPHEDHLIPLMVVAGAAGADVGHRVFTDHFWNIPIASYQFGSSIDADQG